VIDDTSRSFKERKDVPGVRYFCKDVPGLFLKHFQNFLGTESKVQPMEDNDQMFFKKLNADEASEMIKDITDKEVKAAMFDIDNDKALGIDGYTSYFFKNAWSIVGVDICEAVKEFFQTRKLLEDVNATLISLIPKMNTPNKVSDFRPIACCNVLYKCISKVITNRIKSGLEKLVSINQSAFIPGISIQDNILLTQELLKGYNRKNGPKRYALMIDLQKAYDTLNWSFLGTILKKFGFYETMVN
ncbi:RNA-directed DNA polymerase, eukaryota, reverse transcriptase zinc-binding domain protein, partial [Tanacetum coccineum]